MSTLEPRPADTRHLGAGDTPALRALAHPTRIAILGALRTSGPATVGDVAAAQGIAAGSASYHLRTLARHGFVEEVEAPPGDRTADRRTRWWRASARATRWEPSDFGDTPDGAAAVHALERIILDRYHERAVEALERRDELDERWRATPYLADDVLRLSLDDTAALREDVEALMARWRLRSRTSADPEGGARPVALVVQTFPDPAPHRSGTSTR